MTSISVEAGWRASHLRAYSIFRDYSVSTVYKYDLNIAIRSSGDH